MSKIDILNVPIDGITNDEAFRRVVDYIKQNQLKKIYTPNPEIVMLAQRDDQLLRVLQEGDLVIPDGIGLIIASRLKNKGLIERVTGVDLMEKILHYCNDNGNRMFILGGKPGVAEKAVENIQKKYQGIQIAGHHHGYFSCNETNDIIRNINTLKVEVLFVCLGAPKQELWIDENKDKLKCKVAMGVGGSVDVYAGIAKRAPIMYQKMGLEWLYRLLQEPWRYKRMLLLPKFLIRFILKG